MFDNIKLGERIRSLRGQVSQDQCAKDLGISRGALSFYENGDRKPDSEVIYKMCKYFEVSADYILGLSDLKSIDENIKTACKVTGLEEEAVLTLVDFRKNHILDKYSTSCAIEILNLFLEDWHFFILLFFVYSWISSILEYSENKKNICIDQNINAVENAKKLLTGTIFGVVEADLINDLKMDKANKEFFNICHLTLNKIQNNSEILKRLEKAKKEGFDVFKYYEETDAEFKMNQIKKQELQEWRFIQS